MRSRALLSRWALRERKTQARPRFPFPPLYWPVKSYVCAGIYAWLRFNSIQMRERETNKGDGAGWLHPSARHVFSSPVTRFQIRSKGCYLAALCDGLTFIESPGAPTSNFCGCRGLSYSSFFHFSFLARNSFQKIVFSGDSSRKKVDGLK